MLPLLLPSCAVPRTEKVIVPEGTSTTTHRALQPPTGRFLKRKVAVQRFSNETTYGKSVLLGKDILGKQASDIIMARLSASQKFLLFDGEVASSSIATPDYKLIGSVTEFGRATSSKTGVWSKTKTQVARAAVSLRIVDTRSGIVIFSAEGRGEAVSSTGKVLGVGTAQGFDSTLSERAISAAISNVVGTIAERMLDSPWRSSILDVDAKTCTIGGGRSQGLTKGTRLAVLRRGKVIRNPQTNAQIELPGDPIAEILVRTCHGKSYAAEFAVCDIVSGSVEGHAIEDLVIQEVEER